MNGKEARVLFHKIQREALRLAERCNFSNAEAIKAAKANCRAGIIIVCVEYRDAVDRVHALTAFAYGAILYGVSFFTSSEEDITIKDVDGRGKKCVTTATTHIATIYIDFEEGK